MGKRVARTLEELEAEFRALAEQASGLAGRIDPTVLGRRPEPGHWSAAECLAHLNISADAYFPIWEREIPKAQPREHGCTYRLDFWGRVLVWTLEPPPKFRLPAPRDLRPVTVRPETVFVDFEERQRRIVDAMAAARGRAIDQVKITSPFDSRVRYSIWSSFCLNAAHERRHLLQAEKAAGLS